jgi:GYF domain 2
LNGSAHAGIGRAGNKRVKIDRPSIKGGGQSREKPHNLLASNWICGRVPMVDTWYVADRERSVGPFNLAQLKSVLKRNPNWKELLVWQDGYREWQRAGSIEEIAALFAAPIPETGAVDPPKLEPKKSRARPILIGISVLAAAVVGGVSWIIISGGAHNIFRLSSPNATAIDLERGFADAVAKMRAVLPKKVDATTILTDVNHEGKTMLYKNIILMDGANFDATMKEKLRQSVIKSVCGKTETRVILDLGGSFRYLYSDIEAKPVFAIDVVKQSCS